MVAHYMTSPSPENACVGAGHRSMHDYRPPHKYAEPSSELINLVFGVVLTVRDSDTGEERRLNVDEAIAFCREYDDNNPQKLSAAPFFQVLRLFAKTLLQVRMQSSGVGQCVYHQSFGPECQKQ